MAIQNLINLADACSRDRALDEYGASQEQELARFAAAKRRENREIEAELERVAAQYRARIEANIDEIVRYQEALAAWERWKEREVLRAALTESAQLCSR